MRDPEEWYQPEVLMLATGFERATNTWSRNAGGNERCPQMIMIDLHVKMGTTIKVIVEIGIKANPNVSVDSIIHRNLT